MFDDIKMLLIVDIVHMYGRHRVGDERVSER
jgi:hypothetical protein